MKKFLVCLLSYLLLVNVAYGINVSGSAVNVDLTSINATSITIGDGTGTVYQESFG